MLKYRISRISSSKASKVYRLTSNQTIFSRLYTAQHHIIIISGFLFKYRTATPANVIRTSVSGRQTQLKTGENIRVVCGRGCLKSLFTKRQIKMVNGSRYYTALESVSIAPAYSSALTIFYPCQIRVHQRLQSKLQLLTARKKEWRPATADSLPVNTVIHTTLRRPSRPRTHNHPIVSPTRYQ